MIVYIQIINWRPIKK